MAFLAGTGLAIDFLAIEIEAAFNIPEIIGISE